MNDVSTIITRKKKKRFNFQIDKINKDEFQPTNDKPLNYWPRGQPTKDKPLNYWPRGI